MSPIIALLVLIGLWSFYDYGIGPLTQLVTGKEPAPMPSSLVSMFVALTIIAILIYVSAEEERWKRFTDPIAVFLCGDELRSLAARTIRWTLLVGTPIALGYLVWARETKPPEPPADPPTIHFDLPIKYADVKNPLPWTEENIRQGGILFTRNCAACHGDSLDGKGIHARAFLPKPANFRDTGTIAQLDENYLYWRIKEGGVALPKGTIEYRSAMPAWEKHLSDEEIWKIIMFEYTNAGVKPAKRE